MIEIIEEMIWNWNSKLKFRMICKVFCLMEMGWNGRDWGVCLGRVSWVARLREYWVCDVVVGVVGEGDGDGVAGILEDFFYSV